MARNGLVPKSSFQQKYIYCADRTEFYGFFAHDVHLLETVENESHNGRRPRLIHILIRHLGQHVDHRLRVGVEPAQVLDVVGTGILVELK